MDAHSMSIRELEGIKESASQQKLSALRALSNDQRDTLNRSAADECERILARFGSKLGRMKHV